MNTTENQNPENTTSRPFGCWIKAVDRLMAAEFAAAFEGEKANRRDWRLLNVVDGTAPARRPLNGPKLRRLVERGWIAQDGDGWTLTDEGRAAKDRLSGIVEGIRAKVTDAVSPEDLETTMATLEQIARAFGWDEETPLPRGRGRRGPGHGFGRRHGHPFARHGFGPGFGPGFGHGFGPGFGPHAGPDAEHRDEHECGHGHPGHGFGPGHGHRFAPEFGHGRPGHAHGDHRAARAAQHAYERGFDAGYSRGRDA